MKEQKQPPEIGEVLLRGCRCRCGHEWLPRKREKPAHLPKVQESELGPAEEVGKEERVIVLLKNRFHLIDDIASHGVRIGCPQPIERRRQTNASECSVCLSPVAITKAVVPDGVAIKQFLAGRHRLSRRKNRHVAPAIVRLRL